MLRGLILGFVVGVVFALGVHGAEHLALTWAHHGTTSITHELSSHLKNVHTPTLSHISFGK